MNVGTTRN